MQATVYLFFLFTNTLFVQVNGLAKKQFFDKSSSYREVMSMAASLMNERKQLPKNISEGYSVCNVILPVPLLTEPQLWQTVSQREMHVFSAYYEARYEAYGPSIRIIASGLQAAYNNVGDIYCTLYYEDRSYSVVVGPAWYQVIYPSTLIHDMSCAHFIICPLPSEMSTVPYAVSITAEPCTTASNALLVLNRERVEKTSTHALCISLLYNHFDLWEMIVEIFEMHKILGADEIAIYNFSISAETNKTLWNYLSDENRFVNVIQWPFPWQLVSNIWSQHAAVNDCLYRMGHRHKYVTITDLDEILVPRMVDSWPELLHKIGKKNRGAFLFQHNYFRRNTSDTQPYLITQSSFWTTPAPEPPAKIRSKAMYEASKAISLDLHSPYQLVRGAEEYLLSPSDGLLHHYRKDPMETFRRYPERFMFVEDRYMTKFNETLLRAFKARVSKIKS